MLQGHEVTKVKACHVLEMTLMTSVFIKFDTCIEYGFFYIHQMLTYCDYSLKVTMVHNFMKIVEITQFLSNSACHVTPISKFFQIWNLEGKSFKTSYYLTMFDKLYRQGHLKVMANFDLGDLSILKHNMFLLAIQGLACIPISDS